MNSSKLLADRFREVMLSGDWIAGTNFKKQLDNVTMEQAVTKIGTLNTIAALTFHVDYYLAGMLQYFRGGELEIRDKFSFDMPAVTSDDDWNALREKLISDSEAFANWVEKMDAAKLSDIFVNPKYGTWQRNIEAMIEHGYYHLGQVSLLKKLIREKGN